MVLADGPIATGPSVREWHTHQGHARMGDQAGDESG